MGRKHSTLTAEQLSQEVLTAVRNAGSTGITSQQIALQLGFKDKGQRYLVYDALELLLDSGKVQNGPRGRYITEQRQDMIEGQIDIIASGAGYVRVEGDGSDVYVHNRNIGMALHGDTVLIKMVGGRGGRPEGRVLQVKQRRRTEFVGTIHRQQGRMILIADDQRIQKPFIIPAADTMNAQDGDKTIIELGEWKDAHDLPKGKVIRVLGRAGEHNVEMHAILAEFGLPLEFPESVIKASKEIDRGISQEEISRRRDVRAVPTITIDPEDAKDLDDALSLRRLQNGHWEVGVHIADVSHYVKPGSVIDMEAASRATSVYLVDRVVPMLPEKLSNDLCSLHPHTDKLSFSAIFELDDKARIKQEWFGRTIMNSRRRFAYQEAQDIISGKVVDKESPAAEFMDEVLQLHRLAEVLRRERIENGALEIGGNEIKFKLDEQGKPLGVYEKVMGEANWLIEEFMLLANKRVAHWVNKQKKGTSVPPFIYRVHDLPDPDKVDQLRMLAHSFGHELVQKKGEDLPHAINRLLRDVRGKEEENIIKQIAIRSMAKAIYSTKNIGHYGLAFEHYTHFTSPIRRYPDLLVHRAMAHYLAGGKHLNEGELELSAKHSSRMEKQAADAERASIKYKQAEYLLARIGQTFAGTISGLTNWGIYVELIENKCEGLIGMRDLPGDVFRFDQERYVVAGQRTGRKFRLGDELMVSVKAVDMDRRVVDLALAEDDDMPGVTTSGKFERRKNPQLKERESKRGRATAKGKSKGARPAKKGKGPKRR
jgi:ribonuclease R